MPPASYLVSVAYVWLFPVMVPSFAILFMAFSPRQMWVLEQWIYKKNSLDSYLFTHFERLELHKALEWMYKAHPFFAGIALLLSYILYWKRRDPASESQGYLLAFIASSTVMAYCGGRLVPTMYGNASAKRWTLLQSRLTYVYNSIALLALVLQMEKLQVSISIMSFSFLVWAGVAERFYVLFILPLFATKRDEQLYRGWYSIQFQVATMCSWVCGLLLIWKHLSE